MCVREDRERERKREGVGSQRGYKLAYTAWILSLYHHLITLPPHHHHTAHSHSTIGQHCGLKAVIYWFSDADLISHLRLTLYFNIKLPVTIKTQA